MIHNLARNANDATPEGGIINFPARNRALRETDVLPLPEGDCVEVPIEDHGTGIPRQNLIRIFDPHFTTKEEGSDLGLVTTYSIMKNHKGYMANYEKYGFRAVIAKPYRIGKTEKNDTGYTSREARLTRQL